MPDNADAILPDSLQIAELILQVLGVVIAFAAAVELTRRRAWRDALRLPADPLPPISGIDAYLGLCAVLLIPRLFVTLAAYAEPATLNSTTTAAATTRDASAEPTTWQVCAMVLGQVAAMAALIWIARNRLLGSLQRWGLRWDGLGRTALLAFLAYLAVWPICVLVLDVTIVVMQRVTPSIEISRHEAVRTLLDPSVSAWGHVATILSAVALAPLIEEMFFRGLLLPAIARGRRSAWGGVALSGIAFGLIHWTNPQTVPALMIFGFALGYAYARTRSLSLVILVHALFNAKTILWVMIASGDSIR